MVSVWIVQLLFFLFIVIHPTSFGRTSVLIWHANKALLNLNLENLERERERESPLHCCVFRVYQVPNTPPTHTHTHTQIP